MKLWIFLIFLSAVLLASPSVVFGFARKPKPAAEAAVGKKYACPMMCEIAGKPGKCPKCGMEMWEVS